MTQTERVTMKVTLVSSVYSVTGVFPNGDGTLDAAADVETADGMRLRMLVLGPVRTETERHDIGEVLEVDGLMVERPDGDVLVALDVKVCRLNASLPGQTAGRVGTSAGGDPAVSV